jgi:transmembrane sensor
VSRARREAALWFGRMRNAEPDDPRRGRFEAWLMASPEHAAEYAAFDDLWADLESTPRVQAMARAMRPRRHGAQRRLRAGALALVAVVVGSIAGQQAWIRWPQYELEIAAGPMRRIALPDGSEIVIDAASVATVRYTRGGRHVKLEAGNAIFDVARDEQRPFEVDGGGAHVSVLGTRFAVTRLGESTRVSVERGRVSVESDSVSPGLLLRAGQVAEVDGASVLRLSDKRAEDAFAFERGSLVFDEATLAEVAQSLSRHRAEPVRVATALGAEPRLTGVVQVKDIESFLRMLPTIAPVVVQQHDGETWVLAR